MGNVVITNRIVICGLSSSFVEKSPSLLMVLSAGPERVAAQAVFTAGLMAESSPFTSFVWLTEVCKSPQDAWPHPQQ